MSQQTTTRVLSILLMTLSLSSIAYAMTAPSDEIKMNLGKQFSVQFPVNLPVVRIAVFPFAEDLDHIVRHEIERQLTLKPHYQALERHAIDQVYREQKFQLGSNVDPTTVANLAGQLGAEAVMIGTCSSRKGFGKVVFQAQLKLVDVATGRILWVGDVLTTRSVVWHYLVMILFLALIALWILRLTSRRDVKVVLVEAETTREEIIQRLKSIHSEFEGIFNQSRSVLNDKLFAKMASFREELAELDRAVRGSSFGSLNRSITEAKKKLERANLCLSGVQELYDYIHGFRQTIPDHSERAEQEFARIQETLRRIRPQC